MKTEDLHPRQWTPRVILAVIFIALLYHWDFTSRYLGLLLNGLRPVLTAVIISLLLNAPMSFFEKHLAVSRFSKRWTPSFRRGVGYLVVALMFLLIAFILGRFIIPMVIEMLRKLIGFLTQPDLMDQLRSAVGITSEQWDSTVGVYLNDLSAVIRTYANDLLGTLASVTSSALSFLLYVVLAFYFLAGRDRIRRAFRRISRALFTPARAHLVFSTGTLAANTLSKWFGYQCLEALILGVETFIGMTIFGMPYAAPLACLTAFMQMIPYLGGWISFIVGFLTMLTVDLHTAIIFGIMLFALQQIEGMLVNPHLVGGAVGLPPFLSLAAVVTGSALFGIVGMFLSVPICSVIYTLFKAYVQKKEKEKASPPPADKSAEEEKPSEEVCDADTLSGAQ